MQYKPVKTAVIGCGMISDRYFENLKNRFSIINLVGCSDLSDELADKQSAKYGIRKMTNEEILNDPDIDLVLNLTYASAHFEINRAILNAGKHCYSEKMMCLTMEEADELDRIRREKGVMFAVGPDTFLGAGMQTARFIIDQGLIGTPVQAVCNLSRGYFMTKDSLDDTRRKYSVVRQGAGIPYDMGGYYLHALFNILGPVQSVCGYARTRQQHRPYLNPRHSKFNEDFFVNTINTLCASMEFKNGVLGSLNLSSDYDTTSNEFKIYGTQGILSLGDPNEFHDQLILFENGTETELPLYHPFANESRGVGAAEIAWSLRTGRNPRLSFEMGYHALEIINAVIACTKTGQVQYLKTDFDRPAPIHTEHYSGFSEERSLFLS